jgi:hypothetical protein
LGTGDEVARKRLEQLVVRKGYVMMQSGHLPVARVHCPKLAPTNCRCADNSACINPLQRYHSVPYLRTGQFRPSVNR